MIPTELKNLAQDNDLDNDKHFELRVKFGIACIERAKHLLTDDTVISALTVGEDFIEGKCGVAELKRAANIAAESARSHAGSNSLDGSGNAAVSASYGVAAALSGRALQAAEYAAYASVYSYASYAVTDLAAYEPEQNWQIAKLRELVRDSSQDTVE